jgi:hypothetical protein
MFIPLKMVLIGIDPYPIKIIFWPLWDSSLGFLNITAPVPSVVMATTKVREDLYIHGLFCAATAVKNSGNG